jgi:hypothetical protein
MTITKFTTKSLVFDEDLNYSLKLGIPVEVFSMEEHKTIAFGRIKEISDDYVLIRNQQFCRSKNAFFGCSNQT